VTDRFIYVFAGPIGPGAVMEKEFFRWTSLFLELAFCSLSCRWLTPRPATVFDGKECQMTIDYILGGAVTLFLLAYLTYALVRPERF
jgi:K+-transporting ATPase KdpF subunit